MILNRKFWIWLYRVLAAFYAAMSILCGTAFKMPFSSAMFAVGAITFAVMSVKASKDPR